jgi:hypothetical protein
MRSRLTRPASSGVEAFSRSRRPFCPSDLIATFVGLEGYEQIADPGDDWTPTKRQVGRQRESKRSA